MRICSAAVIIVFLTSFLGIFGNAVPQKNMSVQHIVAENIKAAEAGQKLASVRNYSFSTGVRTYYLSADGRMKVTSGKEPVITQSIVVSGKGAVKNSFNVVTEFKPLMASTYQAQALLRSGFFTLKNFEAGLQYMGKKRFGIKDHLYLMTTLGKLTLEFDLDAETFSLKRMVFKGYDPGQGTYEINHDFGPLQDFDGIKMPASWFSSQVGTRGVLYKVKDVRYNLSLDKDFFSKPNIHIGKVEISTGSLSGSIIRSAFRRNTLSLETNWTKTAPMDAGFTNGDTLVLNIKGRNFDCIYYDGTPPRGAVKKGAVIMTPNRRDTNCIINMYSSELESLAGEIKPLQPIKLTLK